MLIVSNFHDYYDSAMATGIDKTVVYNRKTQELISNRVPGGEKEVPISDWTNRLKLPNTLSSEKLVVNGQGTYESDHWLIGFCGQIIPVIHIHKMTFGIPVSTHYYFYKKEQVEEILTQEDIELNDHKHGSRYGRHYFRSEYAFHTKTGINNLLDNSKYKKLEDVFQAYKTPIFIWGSNWAGVDKYETVLILNPKLKDIEFMKVKDPFTAFQEIYMFISGVIGIPAKPMIEISDKDKAAAKGHDGKYSFKKPPGGGQWR